MEACADGCANQAVAEAQDWPWPRFNAADLDRALERSAPTYPQLTDQQVRRLIDLARDAHPYRLTDAHPYRLTDQRTWVDRVWCVLAWRPRWVMRRRWRP